MGWPRIRITVNCQTGKRPNPRNARMIGGGGRVWGAARGEDGHGVRPATL